MQKSDPRISDFDHFLKELNTFLPPQFICALSYTALISQLNRTLIKLPFIVYREKISEIGLELWPFSEDFFFSSAHSYIGPRTQGSSKEVKKKRNVIIDVTYLVDRLSAQQRLPSDYRGTDEV